MSSIVQTVVENLLKLIVPVAIKFIKEQGDKKLKGEELNNRQLMLVWNARNVVGTFGKSFAAETDNTYDDEGVVAAVDLAEDTLDEGNIEYSSTPDFGEEEPQPEE